MEHLPLNSSAARASLQSCGSPVANRGETWHAASPTFGPSLACGRRWGRINCRPPCFAALWVYHIHTNEHRAEPPDLWWQMAAGRSEAFARRGEGDQEDAGGCVEVEMIQSGLCRCRCIFPLVETRWQPLDSDGLIDCSCWPQGVRYKAVSMESVSGYLAAQCLRLMVTPRGAYRSDVCSVESRALAWCLPSSSLILKTQTRSSSDRDLATAS